MTYKSIELHLTNYGSESDHPNVENLCITARSGDFRCTAAFIVVNTINADILQHTTLNRLQDAIIPR